MGVAFIHFFYMTDNQYSLRRRSASTQTVSCKCWFILKWFDSKQFLFGSDFCLSFEFLFNWFPLAGSDLVPLSCNSFL